jgi:hypothetical protein
MLNFYGLLYGIILIDYALEIQEQDMLKQGWNTKKSCKIQQYEKLSVMLKKLLFSGFIYSSEMNEAFY